MRPNASDPARSTLSLNEIFGSKGQVRLLRILATETDGFVASPEIATRAGLTRSGARKALRRLVEAGLVEKVGSGRHTRYVLNEDDALAEEIVKLFETERKAAEPGWARERSRQKSPKARRGNGTGSGLTPQDAKGNGGSPPARVLDAKSPEFHGALASLLEEELSLIQRARRKVLEELKNRQPGNGHDLWEWRKVLETYPVPRLLHFLESESPRAQRLRKSSPFPAVMSEKERERLKELVERVH